MQYRQVDTPDCELVVLHRSDLWQVTSVLGAMSTLFEHTMERVHALEAVTGRQWCGR